MTDLLVNLAGLTGFGLGALLTGAGIGIHLERRRKQQASEIEVLLPEEQSGRHCAGYALGSSAQRARVKGAVTEQFDLIVTDFTPEELDRIRSTT